MERVTITIPNELLQEAKDSVAAGQARSVSAWITDRIRGTAPSSLVAADVFAEFLAEIETRNATRQEWPAEKQAARRLLDEIYGDENTANTQLRRAA